MFSIVTGFACVFLQQSRTTPPPMWGVTIDDVTNITAITTSLSGFKVKPTARVVFDPGMVPLDYLPALKSIGKYASVMGEPVDSFDAAAYTVPQYRARFADYMDQLGSLVSVWEIGNEVNGDWTGKNSDEVNRLAAAYQEGKKRFKKIALTLFYSDGYLKTDRDLVTWSTKYLPTPVKTGTDYVLISFYPTSATGTHPNWTTIFTNLSKIFPNSRFGFGELGLANADGTLSTNVSAKKALIQRYYQMASPLPGKYINGYFWWTFAEDATPKTAGLWSTFYSYIH